MITETFDLWNEIPCECFEVPQITAYIPDEKKSDGAVVIFPGGAYADRARHEGAGYARFLAENGIIAFDVAYRVGDHKFPCQLLDARRSVKFARFYAEKYGIDKNKIAVMGSSAGGHLAAMTATRFDDLGVELLQDEIEQEDFVPNAQILCYSAIMYNLEKLKRIFENPEDVREEDVHPNLMVSEKTPPAFIWQTAADEAVHISNSLAYASALKEKGIGAELHIFPDGKHGIGICVGDINKYEEPGILAHNAQWTRLLLNWLEYIGF